MFNHQPHRQEDRVQNPNSHLPKFPALVTPTKEELSQTTSQEHSPNRSMKPLIDWHQFLPTIEEHNGQCQESQGSFQMPHQDVEGLIIVNRFNQIQWMSHAAQRIFQSPRNQLIGNEFFGNLVEPISQSNLDSKSLLFFLETVAYSQATYCQTVKVCYEILERVPPHHSVNLWQLQLLPSEWENERVYEVTLSPFPIHLPFHSTPPHRFISPAIPAPADDQGILVVDLDQKVIAYNQILCEVWNLPKPASKFSKNLLFSEIFSRLQTPKKLIDQLEYLNRHPDQSSENELLLKDGCRLNCISIPFRETPEKIIGRIWYFRKIHHQLPVPLQPPAEIVQLHPNEVSFQSLFEDTAVGIAIADLQEGRILKSNSTFQQMLGYTVDELATLTFQDLTHPDDLKSDLVLHQEMIAGYRESFQLEKRYIHKNREIIWARLSASLARNVQGIPQFSIGLIENITPHKQVEEALLEVTKAVESCCDAIAITDTFGIPTFLNPAFLDLFEYSMNELKNAGGLAALYQDQSEAEAMLNAIQQGLSWRNEQPMYSRTGREIQILLRVNAMTNQAGEVIGLVSIYTDISERKRSEIILQESEQALRQKTQQLEQTLEDLTYAQAQLIQQEKMLSLGQLVAGVSHEINNPVSFIYGNIEHAKDYIEDLLDLLGLYQKHYPQPASEIQAKTQEIDLNFLVEDLPNLLLSMKMGSERICNLILSLRNFCRLDEAQKKSVDIHEGIESTLVLLQNRLKTKGEKPAIQLIKHYGDLPNIECYPGQLNQVFMNLLTNAIDALDEIQAQRKIIIQTEILNSEAVIIAVNEPLPHATENFVVIRFKDNGLGIAPIHQSKLFDPFFTTKPIGKGTGLGLAIAYQIITQKHQGIFKCFSQIGQGAEFLIAIPIL